MINISLSHIITASFVCRITGLSCFAPMFRSNLCTHRPPPGKIPLFYQKQTPKPGFKLPFRGAQTSNTWTSDTLLFSWRRLILCTHPCPPPRPPNFASPDSALYMCFEGVHCRAQSNHKACPHSGVIPTPRHCCQSLSLKFWRQTFSVSFYSNN